MFSSMTYILLLLVFPFALVVTIAFGMLQDAGLPGDRAPIPAMTSRDPAVTQQLPTAPARDIEAHMPGNRAA